MTLDLGRLSAEIRGMSDHLAANRGVLEARIAGARDLLATADREALAAAAEAKRGAVIPVEDLTTRVAGDTLPDGYQVLATDGSDIEPDRHGPALCYVINVGWAVIEYGAQPRAELASAPALYYRPDDLYVRDGNRQAPIQGSRLGAKRAVAEMQRLAALCAAGNWDGGIGDGEWTHGSASSAIPPPALPYARARSALGWAAVTWQLLGGARGVRPRLLRGPIQSRARRATGARGAGGGLHQPAAWRGRHRPAAARSPPSARLRVVRRAGHEPRRLRAGGAGRPAAVPGPGAWRALGAVRVAVARSALPAGAPAPLLLRARRTRGGARGATGVGGRAVGRWWRASRPSSWTSAGEGRAIPWRWPAPTSRR